MDTAVVDRTDADARPIRNAMTVDVEDYFQVSAFADVVKRSEWDSIEGRVEANTGRVLELFAAAGARATFFTLGWVAERHPALIRRIVAEGHELASHGLEHKRVSDQTAEAFRTDIRRTKRILEDVSGGPVVGYRAASFSIGAATPWAHRVLAEEGYKYSSSIYPVRHDHYGMPDAPRFAYRPDGAAGVLEVPMTTVRLMGRNLPCSGGGYFRLMPYAIARRAIALVNKREHQPAVFYFHPWEVDPAQPRPSGISAKTRFRHYLNLGRMAGRLGELLSDFAWERMDRVYPIA